MLFSEEACEIISTFACCSATASNAGDDARDPLHAGAADRNQADLPDRVTALTPGVEGSPSTLTRVPGCDGLKLLRMRTGMRLRNAGRIVL